MAAVLQLKHDCTTRTKLKNQISCTMYMQFTSVLQRLHALLNVCDGLARVQMLGACLGAVHDRMTSVRERVARMYRRCGVS